MCTKSSAIDASKTTSPSRVAIAGSTALNGRATGVGGSPYAAPMRAIWKGAVSFGLVSVPVKLYAATESHDVSFRQVHANDGGRIKYQRVCSIDGEEVPYSDIAKGYETEDGEMVILDDDDFAELPSASSREIAVEKFVPREQIDPIWFEKSYYLEPEKSGTKPYSLLRQALLDADRMAVVTVAIRNRTSMAVLRVRDDVIVLQTMMWPDEVRAADFSVESGDVKPAEVKMANMLVETLAGDFDASEFEDDYAGAVEALVKAKIEGGEVKKTPTSTKSSGEVVDLLAALQRSVDAAKTARGESSSRRTTRTRSRPRRRPRRRPPPRRPRRRRRRPRRPPPRRRRRRPARRASPRAAAESGRCGRSGSSAQSLSRGATMLSSLAEAGDRIGRRSAGGPPGRAPPGRPPARGSAPAADLVGRGVGTTIGVCTRPNRMLVNVTPSAYVSRPAIRDQVSSAVLEAMYAENFGAFICTPQVPMLTTCPNPCARIAGSSPIVSRTGPK